MRSLFTSRHISDDGILCCYKYPVCPPEEGEGKSRDCYDSAFHRIVAIYERVAGISNRL